MKARTQYTELGDLQPRVKFSLMVRNWSIYREAKLKRGRADFVAIQRESGKVRLLECKTHVTDVEKIANQINGYWKDLGIPSAKKWLATYYPLRPAEIEYFAAHDISHYALEAHNIVVPSHIGESHYEFMFWFKYWQIETVADSTAEGWSDTVTTTPEKVPVSPFGRFPFAKHDEDQVSR